MPLEEIEYRPHQSPRTVDDTGVGAAPENPRDDYPAFALPIVNHSPGGYCLTWPKEMPSQLQAGELLGLQDPPEHRRGASRWCAGSARSAVAARRWASS